MQVRVCLGLLLVLFWSYQIQAASIKIYNLGQSDQQKPSLYQSTFLGSISNPEASVPQLNQILKSENALHPKAQLVFEQQVQNPYGFAQKFTLKYGNIPVAGNSLIATFDHLGFLKSIVHDLPNQELSLADQMISKEAALISSKQAFEHILSQVGIAIPTAVHEAKLAIVQNRHGVRILVWRMKIGSVLVDIGAAGESEGQVVDVNTLVQDVDIEGLLGNASDATVNMFANGTYNGLLMYRNFELTNEGQIYSFVKPDLVSNQMGQSLKIIRQIVDLYQSDFKLDGFDGQGQRVKVMFAQDMSNNAFWTHQIFVLPTNSDQHPEMQGLGQAADVLGHEYTHAVIQYSSDLLYMSQSGALNESLADCFGEFLQFRMGLQKQPWKIGESVNGGKGFRDMRNPELSQSPQPRHMDDLKKDEYRPYVDCKRGLGRDNCGVHVLSGIPNRAFSLIVDSIGWTDAMALYYPVMSLRLHPASNFRHLRNAIMDQCDAQLPAAKCVWVDQAFQQVGL